MTRQFTASGKEVRNGEIRPHPDCATGYIWQVCDRLAQLPDAAPVRKEVLAVCVRRGMSPVTVSNQISRWRRFYGFTNRQSA